MIISADVLKGIIIGGAGGTCAGIAVLFFTWSKNAWSECKDKKNIYKWMQKNTVNHDDGKKFRSTRVISSYNNLTEDRVRYICSIHPKIFLSTGTNEDMWGIHARKEDGLPSPNAFSNQ